MPNPRVLAVVARPFNPFTHRGVPCYKNKNKKRKEKVDILLSYNIGALLAAADELNSLSMAVPVGKGG